jgi:4-amino-4-deoxy-L-arabinose transferase-like glycosyltransferase
MDVFSTIFSLLVAAAGWYYMFYSRAVANLSGIENESLNRRRQRLRRIGGFVMFVLAIALFAGFHSVDSSTSAQAFVLVWLAVFLLLLTVLLLAMADLRLTWKLRRGRHRGGGFEVEPPRKHP